MILKRGVEQKSKKALGTPELFWARNIVCRVIVFRALAKMVYEAITILSTQSVTRNLLSVVKIW